MIHLPKWQQATVFMIIKIIVRPSVWQRSSCPEELTMPASLQAIASCTSFVSHQALPSTVTISYNLITHKIPADNTSVVG